MYILEQTLEHIIRRKLLSDASMGSQSSVELPVENPNSDIEMKAFTSHFARGVGSEGLALVGTGTFVTNANALFGDL